MTSVKLALIALLRLLLGATVFPFAALAARLWRREASPDERPAVLFGLSPIISTKYWSQSLRKLGYTTASFAFGLYGINAEGDFDYSPEKLFPRASRAAGFSWLRPYLCFFWGLKNFDVFFLDFDGGFLRETPLRFLEFPLYAVARRKVVAMPYGSDATDVRLCADATSKVAIMQDYPALGVNADKIERRVMHYCRWASFVVCGGVMVDFLPRADLLVTSFCGIDADEWRDDRRGAGAQKASTQAPVKILHAPNHRNIKGTQFLIDACEELRDEGVPVELIIKERVPNQEIKELMREVDIVASAFITGFYELFAVEGMSMGKPVLNYWRPDLKSIYSTYSFASECPVVDTPVGKIKENIRMLAADPYLRVRLGEAGRRYVEKYHSYDAIGRTLDRIIRKAWHGVDGASGDGETPEQSPATHAVNMEAEDSVPAGL
jgi:glycosyltransferase involved in cell wall biosynthesis